MKISQQVQVTNEKLDSHGRAGHVVGHGEGETAGMVEVLLDGDTDPLAFEPADLKQLGE